MTAASMESCQSVVLRSPRGRLGSQLDMGSRLRRMRGRFDQWIQIKTGPQQYAELYHDPPKFSIQELSGELHRPFRAKSTSIDAPQAVFFIWL